MQIEAVKELLDRPIAYHGILAKTLGSVPAAVMLSQGIYWQKIAEKKGAAWFWVTAKDWFDQTGIKADAQLTARAVLKKSGCWHERLFDLPAKMHYQIDVSALLNVISEYLNSGEQVTGIPGNRMPGMPRTASGKFRQLSAGNPGSNKEIKEIKKEINDESEKNAVAVATPKNQKSLLFKAPLDTAPPIPAHPPANGASRAADFGAFKAFDLEAEFAALKTDPFLRESFVLNDRIPAEKFDEYTTLFPVWSRGKGETYNNRKELRGHFHGWARGHWKGEQAAMTKTPTATTDNLPRRAETAKQTFF